MSYEYFLFDHNRKEYVELGNRLSIEFFKTLKESKENNLSFEQFLNNLDKLDYFIDLRVEKCFELLFWLQSDFLKQIYDWMTLDVEFIVSPDIECYAIHEYKRVKSVSIKPYILKSFIKYNKEEFNKQVKYWKENQLEGLPEIKYILKKIQNSLLTIHLEHLDHDDRQKIYDIVYKDGSIDKALNSLRTLENK